VTNFARTERQALSDLMLEVGPDAPTLCEGWDTADLAAHLVIRERRPDSAIGIVVKPLEGWTERVRASTRKGNDFAHLVDQVRSGPPAWSPVRFVPGVDAVTNTVEFFVHHEDVRRAQPGWAPRVLDPALEDVLWSRLARGARLLLRSSPVSLTLVTDDGRSTVAKGDGSAVTARGKPSELTLLAFGRAPEIRVEFEGADDDVRALVGGSYGV
jgi:uncharacterized protein (TIGR03085 family)